MATVTAAHEISLRFPQRIDSPRVDTSRLPGIIRFPLAIVDYLRRNLPPGVRAYCVGGAARDLLLGRTPNDWDLLFLGIRREDIRSLPRTISIRNTTDTIKIIIEGLDVEVTPLEHKNYDPFDPASLEKDLVQDRDLTINSIAIDVLTGEVIDPLNGLRDLQDGTIQFGAERQRRIGDSPLHLLRACRFAAVLGFRLTPEALDLIRRNAHLIVESRTDRERIGRELDKILMAEDPALALEAMASKDLLTGASLLTKLLERAGLSKGLSGSGQWHLVREARLALSRLVIMLKEIGFRGERGEEVDTFMGHYRFSNEERSEVCRLFSALLSIEKLETIYSAGLRKILIELVGRDAAQGRILIESLIELLKIYSSINPKFSIALGLVDGIAKSGDPLAISELDISGGELAREVNLQGKEIGQAQQLLLEIVAHNPSLNEREKLLGLARSIKALSALSVEDRLQRLASAAQLGNKEELCVLVPEFAGLDRRQNNPYHEYPMDEHTLKYVSALSTDPAISAKLTFGIILAALLHDIAKPASEKIDPEGKSQYLQHDEIGARELAPAILSRLGLAEGVPLRETILALIGHHMAPVRILELKASGQLTDKALGRFIRETLEPPAKLGIDLDIFLAIGRADILASQGPECLARFGVLGQDALIETLDKLVMGVKQGVAAYYEAQQKAQAAKSSLENAHFTPEDLELLALAFATAAIEAGVIAIVIQKIREGEKLPSIFGYLGKNGHGKKVSAIKEAVANFMGRKQS